MGTFYTGNTPLPPLKTDASPPQGLSTELDAADINNLWAAAADLRAQLQLVTGNTVTGAEPGMQLGAQTATQIITSKLTKGLEDAFITVLSDSTSYTYSYNTTPNPIRWVTRFATGLGARYPAYTVKFNEWDDTTHTYLGWVTLQTGTGAQTLWVSNASYPGIGTAYVLGQYLSPMVLLTTPDLLIISHGHNEGGIGLDMASDMLNYTEELGSVLPNASILIIGQNPQTSPMTAGQIAAQATRVARYGEVAGMRGYGFLNIYQAFLDYGPTWTTALLNSDGLHPNDAGSQLWADEVTKAFAIRRYSPRPSRQRSTLTIAESGQLLINGNFSEWDNGVPAHWGGTAAHITQDATNFESTNGYSVKITTVGAADYINQSLPLPLIRGKWVTFAARVYVAAGQPLNAGWIYVLDNLGNQHTTAAVVPWGQGGFRWKVTTRYFDPAITSAQVRLYGDGGATSGAASFDRVSAVVGLLPFDVPMNRDAIRYYRVNADFTIAANTSLQAIPGLLWTVPPVYTNFTEPVAFEVHLIYSQATATAAVAFGVKATATMSNLAVQGRIQTDAQVFTGGSISGVTSIAAATVVSGTPAAIGTNYIADLHGVQELVSAGTNSMQIMVSSANASDLVTIKRGSYAIVKFY